jgi:hypothetical protein
VGEPTLDAEEKWLDEKTPLGQTHQIALSDEGGLKGDGSTVIDLAERETLSDRADSANAEPSLPGEGSGRDESSGAFSESESGSDSESEDDDENNPHAAINDNGGNTMAPAAHHFQGGTEEVVEGSLSPTPPTIFVAPAAEPSDGNEGWTLRLRTRTRSATPAPLPVVRSTAGKKRKVVAETPVEMASTDASYPVVKKLKRRGKEASGATALQTVTMPPPPPTIPAVPSARKRKRTPARQETNDEESVVIALSPKGAKRTKKAAGSALQDTNRSSVAAADSSAVDGGRQLRNRTVAAPSLPPPASQRSRTRSASVEPTRRSARVAAAVAGKRGGKRDKK